MKISDALKKLDTEFQPKYFNSSEIDDFLKTNEKKVIILLRVDENKKSYDNFDKDFSAYLEKLPNSPLKNAVGFLFNKRLVFFGTAKNVDGTTYCRTLISRNEKLAGIVLNSYALDISIKSGATPSIDECIYSTYYGLIRSAVLIHKNEINKDKELQKYIANFLFVLMLKVLGRNISFTEHQKLFLQLITTYIFYRQFFEEKHPKAIKIIAKDYSDVFSKETMKSFEPYLDKFSPYSSFKDFPKMVQAFNISDVNPAQLTMNLIRTIGSNGFHTLIGTLDNLIASIILGKYPTEIISRGFSASTEYQEKIEKKLINYINKISYADEFNKLVEK